MHAFRSRRLDATTSACVDSAVSCAHRVLFSRGAQTTRGIASMTVCLIGLITMHLALARFSFLHSQTRSVPTPQQSMAYLDFTINAPVMAMNQPENSEGRFEWHGETYDFTQVTEEDQHLRCELARVTHYGFGATIPCLRIQTCCNTYLIRP